MATPPSNNPGLITLKRKKREDEPPDTLVIRRSGTEATAGHVCYVRQNKRRDPSGVNDIEARGPRPVAQPKKQYVLQRSEKERKRKRAGGEEGLATFMEVDSNLRQQSVVGGEVQAPKVEVPDRPFKKPSRQARPKIVNDEVKKPETEEERRQMESLAEYLHDAAMEEVKRETRPVSKVAPPKISGQKAREMHRQRVEKNNATAKRDQDVEMSDGDYVYDTYVLATSPSQTAELSPVDMENLGYLIIAPGDEDLWETYLLDETTSDADADTDDEDENAEDYYGADYPEDELSEDDEYGKGAYGYRRDGAESDGEEWDEDEAAWSDDGGSGDEMERMMNPFRHQNGVRRLNGSMAG